MVSGEQVLISSRLKEAKEKEPLETENLFVMMYTEMKRVMNTTNAFLYNIAKASAKKLGKEMKGWVGNPLYFTADYLVNNGFAKSIEVDEKRMVIRGKGLIFGSRLKSSEPADAMVAGIIAGLLEGLTEKRVDVKEVACEAKGDPYCEFKVFIK